MIAKPTTHAPDPSTHAARIAALNDAFRCGRGEGRVHVTAGVMALGGPALLAAMALVRDQRDFDAGNDPYGEHDFGSLMLGGERLLWKIDCYDRALLHGSPDPTDPAVTIRVLTIMLAGEY